MLRAALQTYLNKATMCIICLHQEPLRRAGANVNTPWGDRLRAVCPSPYLITLYIICLQRVGYIFKCVYRREGGGGGGDEERRSPHTRRAIQSVDSG